MKAGILNYNFVGREIRTGYLNHLSLVNGYNFVGREIRTGYLYHLTLVNGPL